MFYNMLVFYCEVHFLNLHGIECRGDYKQWIREDVSKEVCYGTLNFVKETCFTAEVPSIFEVLC
jgi:hypothetical protein